MGRALRGLAVSEIASSTLGVRNANWKLLAFVFNAVFCGIAGGLFAFVYTAVSPQTFTFSASVLPIVMMLIGGDRSIWGSVVGAVIMTWVVNAFSGSLLQYNGAVYSVIMILLLLFLPAGILGLRPKMARRLWAQIKGETLQEAPLEAAPQVVPVSAVGAVAGSLGSAPPTAGATGAAPPKGRRVAARRAGPAEGTSARARDRSCASRTSPCISAASRP